MPRFAGCTFRKRARKEGIPELGNVSSKSADQKKQVVLWADTFNNYFHPETCQAALEVLTEAGFQVRVSGQHLCCGRPLYDFGMLDRAKAYLERILQALSTEIDTGIPIIVLEPSCASVFRDEMRGLFPSDARAAKLRSQTFLLSEFLDLHAPGYQPPQLSAKVLLHGHCHQKSLMKMTSEESLLRKMGVEVNSPDSGCCGMAGGFGFEESNYAVSQAVGERVLLPAVRDAAADTLIVSNGFSCREQIRQGTGRKALHLSEVLRMGLAGKNQS
jgi:Fe-S oxidoreductase